MGDLRVKLKARPEISWEYKQGTRRIRIEIPTNERNFPFSRKFFNEANYAQLVFFAEANSQKLNGRPSSPKEDDYLVNWEASFHGAYEFEMMSLTGKSKFFG